MRDFLKGFVYAFKGIFKCIKEERNFRIHLIAVFYVTVFALIYGLSGVEWILLIITYMIVLSLEAVNSSIERSIDFTSKEISPIAAASKDIAAGAVLISAFGSVAIAVILFSDISKWINVIQFLKNNIILTIVLIISLLPSFIFIKGAKK